MSANHLCVNGVFKHPEHGYIFIRDGAYMRNGRLSNHWYWSKVNPSTGIVEEKQYNGYGGDWPAVKVKKVKIEVQFA